MFSQNSFIISTYKKYLSFILNNLSLYSVERWELAENNKYFVIYSGKNYDIDELVSALISFNNSKSGGFSPFKVCLLDVTGSVGVVDSKYNLSWYVMTGIKCNPWLASVVEKHSNHSSEVPVRQIDNYYLVNGNTTQLMCSYIIMLNVIHHRLTCSS